MPLQRLLILSYTDARYEPRIQRQAAHLRKDYKITLAGLTDVELDGVEFLPVRRRAKNIVSQGFIAANLLLGNYGPAMRRFAPDNPEKAFSGDFDLVLVHDPEPFPLAFALAKGAPVVFDAHEYYPRWFESSLAWRLFFQRYLTSLCAEYIPRCAGMITVCPGIADEYRRVFGRRPEVAYSGPEYMELPVNPADPGGIRLVHHGAARPNRCLELMISLMDHTDSRFTLDMYLVGDGPYMRKLQNMAAARKNVRLRDPVPMPELTRLCNRYDMGLYLLPPTGFNTKHMLPNKFFEFIQARIGVAIGPSVEMAPIVGQHGLGVIAEDFTPRALAEKLNALTAEDITRFKRNADKAAEIYTAEASLNVLRAVLAEALRDRASPVTPDRG
ncbi:MAG: glycosyltransferase [Desulfovibrio sp.]|nr:glycosyltransferase [Desulfovibrio sp.]